MAFLNQIQLRKKDLKKNLQTDQRDEKKWLWKKEPWSGSQFYRFNVTVFTVTKSVFRDGLSIRYNIKAKSMPINCPCGKKFTISHALHCAKGV